MMPRKAVRGGIWFLISVLLLYGIAYTLDPESASRAVDRSLAVASRLLPTLGIVVLVLFLSNLLLRHEWVRDHLGDHAGARGWFLAAVGGILAAGPVYPWYALLSDMKAKGMRTALLSVFLYTRAVKLPLLPLLVHYFGLAYALILMGYLILSSFPAGLMVEWLLDGSGSRPSARHRDVGDQNDDP